MNQRLTCFCDVNKYDGIRMGEKKLLLLVAVDLFFDDEEETSRPITNVYMCQVRNDVLLLLTLPPSRNVNINNILFHFCQQEMVSVASRNRLQF